MRKNPTAAKRNGSTMIKWGAGIMIFLGAGHTLIALAVTAPRHAGTWFTGGLWGSSGGELADMTAASGAYWVSLGSFGVPHLLIGLTILWLGRRDIAPPSFIPWTLAALSVIGTVILLPAPWPLDWIAAVLVLVGARRMRRQAEAGRASAAEGSHPPVGVPHP